MEYHLFNITDTMSTRGNNDLVAHAFLAGIIGFLVTAVIYGYATDIGDKLIQQNTIRNLEEKVESLEVDLQLAREQAEYNGETANELGERIQELEKVKADLIGVLESTLNNYKTD